MVPRRKDVRNAGHFHRASRSFWRHGAVRARRDTGGAQRGGGLGIASEKLLQSARNFRANFTESFTLDATEHRFESGGENDRTNAGRHYRQHLRRVLNARSGVGQLAHRFKTDAASQVHEPAPDYGLATAKRG